MELVGTSRIDRAGTFMSDRFGIELTLGLRDVR
jgi:hypothetical protein